MREELRDLYQSVILEHARTPRNFRRLEDATVSAHGDNPMCGDQLTVFLRLEDGVIAEAAFVGQGCAIALASGSLMTDLLRGRTVEQAERLFAAFEGMCSTGDVDEIGVPETDRAAIDQLRVLSGVRSFPVRIRCATLAWHTMRAALCGDSETTTE
jgi:nitrogen fixation protein NifU and related proteins